jgi:hypothetical protein
MHRPLRSALVSLILLVVLIGGPIGALAESASVTVDNSQAAGAIQGLVLKDKPSGAIIAIKNRHDFWTNIKILSSVTTKLVADRQLQSAPGGGGVGDLYAQLGLIGPGGQANWDATFDQRLGGSQTILTSPSLAISPNAGALTILSIVGEMTGGLAETGNSEQVLKAISEIGKSGDFIEMLHDLQNGSSTDLAMHFFKLLNDPTQTTVLVQALSDLNIIVSAALIKKVLTIWSIYNLSRLVVDEASALITNSASGSVTFTAPATLQLTAGTTPSSPPSPNPPSTLMPTSTSPSIPSPSPTSAPSPTPVPSPTPIPTPTPLPPTPTPAVQGDAYSTALGAGLAAVTAYLSHCNAPCQFALDPSPGDIENQGHNADVISYFVRNTNDSRGDFILYAFVVQGPSGWRYLNAAQFQPDFNLEFGVTEGSGTLHVGSGCVNIHATPSTSGNIAGCLANGTVIRFSQEPYFADGTIWWQVNSSGWMTQNYAECASANWNDAQAWLVPPDCS